MLIKCLNRTNPRAVADHIEGKVLPTLAIENFESFPGRGLEATISGLKVSSLKYALAFIVSLAQVSNARHIFKSFMIMPLTVPTWR